MAVTDLSRAVEAWGSAFVKPQFGSFGNGVRKVRPHDPLPESGAWLVQRAIPSPPGWAGIAIRALVQREPEGRWVVAPLVVRRSRHDPVVNAARGAEVVPSDDLPGPTLDMARDLAERAARALADRAALALEFGVDLAVDPDMTPWIVEVNGKPRGRLGVLAARWPERFTEAWNQVLDRPLLTLASFSGPIDSEPT
jgi:glutathione synthase/RimK-type ligase-like ATP-grasp enzyme